ncbi:MAG: hypothetical protein GY867_00155 [bacterium]|nr:hypothetical protein [bacterium]
MTKHLTSQRGVATLIALILVGMLTLIGIAAISTSEDEVTIAGNEMQEMRAFYAAEGGLEMAAAALHQQYDSTGAPPTIMPTGEGMYNFCNVEYDVTDDGAAEQRDLSAGTLAGLHALVKSFTITSTGLNTLEDSKVQLSQTFETALVPIFQFAVFYGNDLEIAPGPNMTLIGRVHSNGDLWVQANSSLNMDSYVTASGDIKHGRKGAGGVSSGDIQIKNTDGDYVSMKMGGDFLDADYSDWYDSSVARWGGRVQDQSHGQSALNLPLTNSDDPHKLIERAAGNPDSYENLATLKIIDGVATRQMSDGTWQDVTAAMLASGALTYTSDKFYDQREGEWVDATEIDVEAMYDNGFAPRNGVAYFSDDISSGSEWPALRLTNGAEIDDNQGLSVVSENPMYTLGDFNSVDKKPVSLMGDAVTFLSNNWATNNYDAKSTASKSDRNATHTTVNASYLTGNTETTSSNYNGGFENLPRFLEKWSNKNFYWTGSAVNLWYSKQANSTWNGTYYSPPIRSWSYDTDLDDPNNLPPESPVVRVFQRTGWRQEHVAPGAVAAAAGDAN